MLPEPCTAKGVGLGADCGAFVICNSVGCLTDPQLFFERDDFRPAIEKCQGSFKVVPCYNQRFQGIRRNWELLI
jgi:hypothetical protein